jgi:hypothetical protein
MVALARVSTHRATYAGLLAVSIGLLLLAGSVRAGGADWDDDGADAADDDADAAFEAPQQKVPSHPKPLTLNPLFYPTPTLTLSRNTTLNPKP